MKKCITKSICVIILAILMLFAGCAAVLDKAENKEIRQNTEVILDALIANDFQSAYSLFQDFCTEEEFRPTFSQMQEFLAGTDTYELKLLSINTYASLSDGQSVHTTSSVYEMTTQDKQIIVSVRMVDQMGLNAFYLTPYELTDYYYTGTLTHMQNATATQWVFLLLNVIAVGLAFYALLDCCRQNIQKKALWILLIILGFVSVGFTVSDTVLRFNFNIGWLTAYSAIIRYGSGTILLRLMLPLGAVIYFIKRRALLNVPAVTDEQKITYPDNTETPQLEDDTENNCVQ